MLTLLESEQNIDSSLIMQYLFERFMSLINPRFDVTLFTKEISAIDLPPINRLKHLGDTSEIRDKINSYNLTQTEEILTSIIEDLYPEIDLWPLFYKIIRELADDLLQRFIVYHLNKYNSLPKMKDNAYVDIKDIIGKITSWKSVMFKFNATVDRFVQEAKSLKDQEMIKEFKSLFDLIIKNMIEHQIIPTLKDIYQNPVIDEKDINNLYEKLLGDFIWKVNYE